MTHGKHRADRRMGPAGIFPPGLSARPNERRVRMLVLVPLLAGSAGLGAAAADITGTSAMFTSTAHKQVNSVTAGRWDSIPAECGDVHNYDIVWGTQGDDTIHAGNHPQIIMGLGGNDRIYGNNSGDCLVGDAGNDKLYGGNARDVIIGGSGNDYLSGGNGPDILDAGGDAGDVCDGGHGPVTKIGCPAPHSIHSSLISQGLTGSATDLGDSATDLGDSAAPSSGGSDQAGPGDAPAPSPKPSDTSGAQLDVPDWIEPDPTPSPTDVLAPAPSIPPDGASDGETS